jgi:hypothetical protein
VLGSQQNPALKKLWQVLLVDFDVLVQETKMVEPRYFYLALIKRAERQSVEARWRTVGRDGTSMKFDDPRMVMVLQKLPGALRQTYAGWEGRRLVLNHRAVVLRHMALHHRSVVAMAQKGLSM